MWKLRRADGGAEAICLLPGKDYVVGRKNCDILLSNDQSISRVHAHLSVTEQVVMLKDSSKYGTFVNNEQVATGSTTTLHVGDGLTFGVFQSKFRLELDSVLVCSSCVDAEGKTSLSQDVQAVGGRLVGTWTQDCTHLVMPVVKVTIKTICALLCCRPVVKPEFFAELSAAVRRKQALPKAESFRPEMGEASLSEQEVDLSPRTERKTLFKDKTFVFLNTKQMKRLSQAISCGSGRSQLLEEGSVPVSLLESPRTCVVDVETGSSQALLTPTTKTWVDSVGRVLHRNGLRFITESEIGLAAIYVNNETYCNPGVSLSSDSVRVRPAIPGASLSQNATVDETVLPPVSQNITAYAANTEPSQPIRGLDICGVAAIGETPEKRPGRAYAQGSTASSGRPLSAGVPPVAHAVPESTRPAAGLAGDRSEETTPQPARVQPGTFKPPQKQSALTNYFQPAKKKRRREGEADSLSEAKLSRKDGEDEENRKAKSSNAASESLDPVSACAGQSQRGHRRHPDFSASLGLGSGVGTSSGRGESDPSVVSGATKRKEPEQDKPSGPEASADMGELDVSPDELESIMSLDMDQPLEPAANKRQRVDPGETMMAPSNQRRAEKQKSVANNIQGLENKGPSAASSSQSSGRKQRESSNKTPDLGKKECSSVCRKDKSEPEDIKDEEVSFAVATESLNSFGKCKKVVEIKQDPMALTSATGTENDPELPKKVMQIQFKTLTVSAPCRPRPDPLQMCDPNSKNFKRFRKLPVPGLHGLPSIIGGSDLVAHSRSKNSELEEWLKDAAKEEKEQEAEDAAGEDLFRYNPKSTKRR
ncbi:nibrin [Brachyhypopomus gauderio]|uniref:nibrin n=1 Tax=Brachyhypopomus gauderio TaxID=698409 RepID=UPI00404208A5